MYFSPPGFYVAALVLAALLLPAAARAQPAPVDTTDVQPLPTITVAATRAATSVAAAPVRVTVLGREAAARAGAPNVADLLEARAGLFVKRYGAGGLATLALRGTGAAQTAILLDGLPIADPQLGQLDLSLLPTLLLDGIEVVHGAGSALYGTDGVGGVVNLRTLHPAGSTLRVTTGAGAWGERRVGALVGERVGRTSALGLVEVEAADGDFPFFNAAAYPARTDRRAGADRQRRSLFTTVSREGRRHRLRIAAWYNDAERGLPSLAGTPPQGERQWDEHLRLWAGDDVQTSWGRLRLRALVQRGALRYVHPTLGLDETGRTLLSTAEAEAQTVRGGWLLAAGVSGGLTRAAHPNLTAGAEEARLSAFTHATGSIGRLLVYPALRIDTYAGGDVVHMPLSPRLGLNLRPFAARDLRLKASAGRSFRVPTFNDRFWQNAGVPDLRPEHGWTVDAGAFLPHAGGHVEVTAFASALRDGIVWAPDPTGTWRPANIHRIAVRGLEASWQGRRRVGRRGAVDGALAYAYTDARDRSAPGTAAYDQPLRYTPRETLKLTLGAALGPAALDLGTRYTGRRYVTTDGSSWLDPFAVVDAGLRLRGRLGAFRAELGVRVENALDARYAILQGYPMPPRHLRVRLLIETSTTP